MEKGDLGSLAAILDSWSDSADQVNEYGTKLIGHEPTIAPKAYRHVIYSGLSPEHMAEFQSRSGQPVPEQYLDFLVVANGMLLFNGSIRVLGYVPLERSGENRIHNYPPSVTASNTYGPLTKAAESNFIVGFYKEDGSYVYADSSGRVARFDYEGDGRVIARWESVFSWLVSEIERLSRNF
ncbi:MAG: hypothetical protein WBM45_14100 [Woeseiaceae bacterium]|jgi:hypothetical protein